MSTKSAIFTAVVKYPIRDHSAQNLLIKEIKKKLLSENINDEIPKR